MNFENDPIAEQTEIVMRRIKKNIPQLSGADYNRVFEAVYDLIKTYKPEPKEQGSDAFRKKYGKGDITIG